MKDILVFASGSLGSKLASLLLLPLYTYYLAQNEFGVIDLVNNSLMLIIPLISLQISDAAYRYLLDAEIEEVKRKIIFNSFITLFSGMFITILVFNIVDIFIDLPSFIQGRLNVLFLMLMTNIVSLLFRQLARGLGYSGTFALADLVQAGTLVVSGILFLKVYQLGINGYFLSVIVANMFAGVIPFVRCQLWRYMLHINIDITQIREMLKYSVPLIPNVFAWWLMNLSDRYVLAHFVGLDAVGTYAVSYKFPTLLFIISNVFNLAWQNSAIKMWASTTKNQFFSKVFRYFYTIFIFVSLVLMIFHKQILSFMVAPTYFVAWSYVPILIVGVTFSAFSSFYGVGYIISKNTLGAFYTSIFGGIINVILNVILVPQFGTYAAAVSTLVAFLVMWLMRIYDTRKYFHIQIDKYNFICNISLLTLGGVIQYYKISDIGYITVIVCIITLLVYLNKNIMSQALNLLKTLKSTLTKKCGV